MNKRNGIRKREKEAQRGKEMEASDARDRGVKSRALRYTSPPYLRFILFNAF
jgi:hypothetical protein